ncbi:hypothetical protein H4R21_000430 [Coemansia helicoidea]|uniref:Uncharacterized protein n=1 Tax=Coemansia helicoidea TaxID=1286919 RepID=A0ACC1LFS3_9FUNG|nr:hypothetical protein H4R21_000430 [Coemansia helicoidea]
MRCQQCSQVTPAASAVRIKGAIYCKKHGTELLRRRSILMRKKSTMGRRSRQSRSRASIAGSDRFVDPAMLFEAAPPVPPMPIHAATQPGAGESQQPRRVTTALRNFLEAAAEQIDATPPPSARVVGAAAGSPAGRRPLPVPQSPPPARQQSPAQPGTPRSIFAGSRDSMYDSNVVNALRMEAQRQINGSQVSIVAPAAAVPSPKTPLAADRDARQMLSPCGPSIADGLNKLRPDSVSSQFDPFEASHANLAAGGIGGFGAPMSGQRPAFAPNAQMDNLERRFRNANFRPPWALTSQSTFQL